MERSPDYQSLKTILEAGPLDADTILLLVSKLAIVLQEEHQEGRAHLYLSPANIWINPNGETLQLSREDTKNSAYLAPEQHHGNDVGIHSDIYTIALILFEMATGSLPEGGERPSDRNADLAPWLDALFDHCYAPRSRRLSNAEAITNWLNNRQRSASFRTGMEVGSEVEESQSESVKVTVPAPDPNIFIDPQPQSRRKINIFASTLGLTCIAFAAGFIAMAGTTDMSGLSGHVGGAFHKAPDSPPWAQYEQALALYKQGKYHESRSVLDELLSDQQNFPQAIHLRGNVLTELGQMNAALVEFNQAVQMSPDNPQIFLDRGNTYVYLKQPGQAIKDFKMYLRLAPNATNNAQIRGWIFELKQNKRL